MENDTGKTATAEAMATAGADSDSSADHREPPNNENSRRHAPISAMHAFGSSRCYLHDGQVALQLQLFRSCQFRPCQLHKPQTSGIVYCL